MTGLGFRPVKWSELTASSFETLDFDSVLVDVHGELAQMYGVGDAAFVGGTYVPVGGHNVLEPVMRGVPLIVGPYYSSFAELVDRLAADGIAYIASTEEEIKDILVKLSTSPRNENTVREEFESIRRNLLDDFAAMMRQAGITEMDKADEKT